jgi:hypothetical protein
VDGTGVMTIDKANVEKFPNALTNTSKNGVITYFIKVLEAKLVTNTGFVISIATEWIENDGEYDKQDCELKAFARLAEKIKKFFPHLPICIVADGLYPNKTIFGICKKNNWGFIITFKDGNLPSVWEDIEGLRKIRAEKDKKEESSTVKRKEKINGKEVTSSIEKTNTYSWINDLLYENFTLNFLEMIEEENGITTHRFVYVSSITIGHQNVREIAENGRIRFKIENEGFNVQKNLGYGMTHKYSRVSMNAVKNYYICIQIAHIINQLFELREDVKELVIGRQTMNGLWRFFVAYFCFEDLSETLSGVRKEKRRIQIRLVS